MERDGFSRAHPFRRSNLRSAKAFALHRHLLLVMAFLTGCRETSVAPPPAASAPAAAAAPAGTLPHGDHNPHHGGIVLMKGDLHYEVVLDPTGKSYRVVFTDAVREDLPASIATDVILTIRRKGIADEIVALQIDDTGESWIGSGRAVDAPATTTVRIAFSVGHEPYFIDVPFNGTSSTRD